MSQHEGCCYRGTALYESFRDTPGQELPDKLDTRAVVEMIKNADLYDLISISLKANDMKDEQVEHFIQRALTNRQSVRASQETSIF